MNLNIKIKNLNLKNPFIPASGCFNYGLEAKKIYDITKWGAILTKTTTLEPREGNNPPRLIETPSGLLNSIGLANPGIEYFIKKIYPEYEKIDNLPPIILSIAGNSIDEYKKLIDITNNLSLIKAYEINVSCPNVKKGGVHFGIEPETIYQLISETKKITNKIIITKLTPNVTDILKPSSAAIEAGSDALTLVNTFLGMSINIKTKKPHFKNIQAGLSGPAIRPMALLRIYKVYEKYKNIPIIGVGGISNINDVIEFLMAGATAIQLGTILFRFPDIVIKLIKELEKYLKDNNYPNIYNIIGIANS